MLNFFKSKDLKSVLNDVKKIKIKGVIFNIKKLDVSNYLDGSKSLVASYDVYKIGNENEVGDMQKKIKEHYRDVFMGAVVSPLLSRKEDGDKICVDEIFMDWDLAQDLYEEIMFHTYGKKKMKLFASLSRKQ